MIKIILHITLIIIAISTFSFAQSESELIGEWDVEFTNGDNPAVLAFKNVNGVVIGFFTTYTDYDGKKHKINDMVHTNVQFDGERGQSLYTLEWDNQSYLFDVKFKMIDDDTIKSTYIYQGTTLQETWSRKD